MFSNSFHSEAGFSLEVETAVDTCPERMDVADADAPGPPRIETVVEFWSGMEVETAAMILSLETAVEF